MGDMGELFNAHKQMRKEERADRLQGADTAGWTKHTEWHFSRTFAGKRFDWWPSGGKARYDGRMIYGQGRVDALIAQLKAAQ